MNNVSESNISTEKDEKEGEKLGYLRLKRRLRKETSENLRKSKKICLINLSALSEILLRKLMFNTAGKIKDRSMDISAETSKNQIQSDDDCNLLLMLF